MTNPLIDAPAEAAVRQRVTALETATGIEVVAAVIARADSYPEIPWKAFALGASVASLGTVAAAFVEPGWEAFAAVAEAAVVVLATGAVAALATIWVAPIARLFLPRARREGEVRQYAQSMFLESGLCRTSHRNGILFLVSLFERQVILVSDHGVQTRIGARELDLVISSVTSRLAQGTAQDALLDGLAKIEETLLANGFRAQPGGINELPDTVIQRQGSS